MLALGETAVLGAFCAQDLALFVLFDLMLIPFYFLIGVWGTAIAFRRRPSSSSTRWWEAC